MEMHYILVSDAISEEGLAPLLEMEDAEIIQKRVDDPEVPLDKIEALLVRSATKVDEELMEKMPSLKIIARAGVGVDNIDVQAATKRGIIVVNAPDGNTISAAEHTFAMMASLMRNILRHINRSKIWNGKGMRLLALSYMAKHLALSA